MTLETLGPAWEPLRPGLLERDQDGGVTLLGSRCQACGTAYYPPHAICVRCLDAVHLASLRLSRRGTVYAYSVVYQSTPEFPTPYVLAYVDLPEGVRVLAQLADVAPSTVHTGMAVEVVGTVVQPGANGAPDVIGYRFRPVAEVAP